MKGTFNLKDYLPGLPTCWVEFALCGRCGLPDEVILTSENDFRSPTHCPEPAIQVPYWMASIVCGCNLKTGPMARTRQLAIMVALDAWNGERGLETDTLRTLIGRLEKARKDLAEVQTRVNDLVFLIGGITG